MTRLEKRIKKACRSLCITLIKDYLESGALNNFGFYCSYKLLNDDNKVTLALRVICVTGFGIKNAIKICDNMEASSIKSDLTKMKKTIIDDLNYY